MTTKPKHRHRNKTHRKHGQTDKRRARLTELALRIRQASLDEPLDP